MATKECLDCEAKIGATEKVCPACGADLEALEEAVTAVEKANKIIARRKAQEGPPKCEHSKDKTKCEVCTPPAPAKKKSIFGALTKGKK